MVHRAPFSVMSCGVGTSVLQGRVNQSVVISQWLRASDVRGRGSTRGNVCVLAVRFAPALHIDALSALRVHAARCCTRHADVAQLSDCGDQAPVVGSLWYRRFLNVTGPCGDGVSAEPAVLSVEGFIHLFRASLNSSFEADMLKG